MSRLSPVYTVVLLLALPIVCFGQSTVLYDETVGNFPGDQSWFLYLTNSPANSSQSYVPAQGVRLMTINSAMAGYFNRNPITGTFINAAFPTLNRAIGFQLRWDLQINSETHANNDRAGFSVIFLASDRRGVELAFWNNEIWVQNDSPIFTHGEGAAFDTTTRTSYQLTLFDNSYDLLANGEPILSGSLRDYSAFGLPYSLGSFLFLGDDTSSADGDITLGRITLLTAVPEPAVWLSMACLAFGLILWYRRYLQTRMV